MQRNDLCESAGSGQGVVVIVVGPMGWVVLQYSEESIGEASKTARYTYETNNFVGILGNYGDRMEIYIYTYT
jgi:hypothetical protein